MNALLRYRCSMLSRAACALPTKHWGERRASSTMAHSVDDARKVLDFWYGPGIQARPHKDWDPEMTKRWFMGGEAVVIATREQFGHLPEAFRSGSTDSWRHNVFQCLAGVIVMDQFTRNVFRSTADMYSLDEKARAWAGHLIGLGDAYTELHPACKMTLCLPYMHSEDLADQQTCLDILTNEMNRLDSVCGPGCDSAKMLANSANYAQRHYDIIKKWGRFPHRNDILGRDSTDEELNGLQDGTIEGF